MRAYCKAAVGGYVPHYLVKDVRVVDGEEIQAGAVVAVSELAAIDGNCKVYEGEAPAAITETMLGLVINDGFETLADGRRPEGNADYTEYVFKGGDVVPAILLTKGMVFEISDEVLGDVAPVVGDTYIPVAGEHTLVAGDMAGAGIALKVLAKKNLRAGGNGGLGFISTSVVEVVKG